MVIEGVSRFAQYRAALAYLQQQPLVTAVHLVAVNGEQMQLRTALAADWQQLDQALALDHQLRPLANNLPAWQQSALGSEQAPGALPLAAPVISPW